MVVKQPFLCVPFWAGLTLLLLPRVNKLSKEKCGYIYLGEMRMCMWQVWWILMVSQGPPVTRPESSGAYKGRVVDIAEWNSPGEALGGTG